MDSLTWFDFVAVIVIALSGVMAFARGFLREMFSLVAFFGAIAAGFFLSWPARPMVEQFTPLDGLVAQLAGGVFIFLLVYIGVTIVVSALAKAVHQSTEIGSFDRAAGLAFGITRGILLGAFLALLLRVVDPEKQHVSDPPLDGIVSAQLYPIFDSVAGVMQQVWNTFAPEAQEKAREYIESQGKSESTTIPPESDASASEDGDTSEGDGNN